ncbi:MAG TPA: ABC transporter ATP-binding protein [Candidatus Limnocylindria bacterium]|jgi:ABC-2 type transport system ATP-binding protein|nr:ABC transporter ATP-binding protein [Candidatus Limnocylindria bacterium]
MSAIELKDVGRTFHTTTGVLRRRTKEIVALAGLTLEIEQGELFGVLGPNGAGKTTMIKILTTLLIPTTGSAGVLGHDVVRDAAWVRPRIGFVFGGERGLYYRLSGRENLLYFSELYRVPPRELRTRVDGLLDMVGLRERADERVEGYSRGMKQRLHLARTLLHQPPVLFLDEPTIGLDPIGARELREAIARLHAEGKTIVLTTHYMFEADSLCQRIAVINAGKLVAEGSPDRLKEMVSDLSVVELEVFGATPAAVERLRALDIVDSVAVEQRELRQLLRIQTPLADRAVPRLLAAIEGIEVGRVTVRQATLEDAYVRLVGRLE